MTGTDFEINQRVTWGDFGTNIYAANGGKIKKISTSALIDMADVDAPTTVTHVDFLDRYLLANETGTRKVWFPLVADPDDWSGEYFSKDAQFDNLLSVKVANLEAYLLGERTLEVWYNDGSTPFSRLGQGFVQSGTVAPYSFVYCDAISSFIWLDHERKVVMMQGRTPEVISASMTKYIQSFDYVADAQGDYMVIAGKPYYILSFKTEDKTLGWDFISKQWYEWGYWNSLSAVYERWRGNCYCLSPEWNMALVGDKSNGKIYQVSPDYFTDDGDTIRMLCRTGHIDRNAPATLKKCKSISLRLKRTQVSEGVSPVQLVVQYRDNGQSAWKTEKTITLSTQTADTEFRARVTQLGSYYARQWQFIYTDENVGCSLVQVQEDFDYL